MLLDIHLKELALLMSKMGGLSNKNVTCNKILSNFLAIPSGTNVTLEGSKNYNLKAMISFHLSIIF